MRSNVERWLILRLQAEAGAHRLRDAFAVDDRQHARHGRVDQRDMGVRLAAEGRGGAGEQLGVRGHLRVDFEADDDLPVARRALDQLRVRFAHGRLLGSEAFSTSTRRDNQPDSA